MFISSATVIVLAGGAIWLNPFATVLFTVCTRVAWVCLVCLLLCEEAGFSPVSAITDGKDMGLHEVPLSVSLLG